MNSLLVRDLDEHEHFCVYHHQVDPLLVKWVAPYVCIQIPLEQF